MVRIAATYFVQVLIIVEVSSILRSLSRVGVAHRAHVLYPLHNIGRLSSILISTWFLRRDAVLARLRWTALQVN